MVGGFCAFLEDIGHAEGVAHLDEPIAQRCCDAIVNAVETTWLPRRDELLFLLAFYLHNVVPAYTETDLRPDAQTRYHGFVLVVIVPLAEVDVEQQRHIDVVRLLHVADGVVAFIQAFLRTHALPRINHIDLGTNNTTLGDERKAHATSEIGAEACAIVAADAHRGESRTEHEATAEALGHHRTSTDEPKEEQYEQFFVFHGLQKYFFL